MKSQPGNSSNPPATIPEYMAVIVASRMQQDGSVITGDVKKIILVKTDPGYGPSPGHPGSGQVASFALRIIRQLISYIICFISSSMIVQTDYGDAF